MATCNQFTAPNGEPSLLYAGLLQKYGEAKAIQVWNWVYAENAKGFVAAAEKDVNGEPIISVITTVVDKMDREPYPGVVNIPDSGLTVEEANEFIDLLQPQILNQAYVENKAATANRMFSFGLRWAKNVPNETEKSQQRLAGLVQRPGKIPIKAISTFDGYGYYNSDQNNKPLPSLKELQPIADFIQSKIGIDLSDYDSVLANIYEPNSFIHQHRDITESASAKGYPVIVINLGAQGGLIYHTEYSDETKVNPNSNSYNQFLVDTSKHRNLPIKNGGIYAFGVDGINRFTFNHRVQAETQNTPTKPLKVPVWDAQGNKTGEKTLKNYRITLTFRRAQDLEVGMLTKPKKLATVEQPVLKNTNQEIPKQSATQIPKERFKASSISELTEAINKVYTEVRNNPQVDYLIPLIPSDGLKVGGEFIKGARLANAFDIDNIPPNIQFMPQMYSLMQNLPKRFLSSIVIEDANPMNLDEASVKKQMDLMFVQIRDAGGNPTDSWFDLQKQNETIDTILYHFYVGFNQLMDSPSMKEELNGAPVIKYLRESVLGKLTAVQGAWQAVNDGKSAKRKPSEQSAEMVKVMNDIVNSFFVSKQRNNLWNFAMTRLAAYGLKISSDIDLIGSGQDVATYNDENGDIQLDEGGGLKDWTDNAFELDMKDTASSRLKLWLVSTVQSRFEDEKKPAEVDPTVDLSVSNEKTRTQLQKGIKTDLVLSAANAVKMGIEPIGTAQRNLPQPEKDRRSTRTTSINGNIMRVTAVGNITQGILNDTSFKNRILEEEGRIPEVGDIVLSIEPYKPKQNQLAADMNFMGVPKLVEFDSLFQDLTALLANREPSLNSYMTTMKENGNANIQRVLQKLQSTIAEGNSHIANEFVSVMSASYQRMLMVLMTKSKDGYLEPMVIDSNRSSEVQTIQKFWQEQQKSSEILNKSDSGQTVIDKNLAGGLYDELLDIYNSAPQRLISYTDAAAQAKYGNKLNEAVANDQARYETDVVKYNERKKDFFKGLMEVNGIILDDKAIDDLLPAGDKKSALSYLGKNSAIKSMFAGFTSVDAKPIGLVDIIVHRLAKAAEEDEGDNDTGNEEWKAYMANNPLYTENTVMKILAKAQLKYTPNTYSQTHKSAEGKTIYSYGLNSALSHAVRKFKEDATYRASFKEAHFAKNSWLLNVLDTQPWILNRFDLVYMDGLKNRYGNRDGVVRSDMSDREQWLTALGLFQNGGNEKSLAHYVSMTHSDKTKTPIFMNGPRMIGTTTLQDGRPTISKHVIDAVYQSVFLAEHSRIRQGGGENIKGYAQGKKFFYMLPQFNHTNMIAMEKAGKITTGERRGIWLDTGELNTQDNILFETVAKKLINSQLSEMVSETIKQWKESGLIGNANDLTIPGNKEYYNRLAREMRMTGEDTNPEETKVLKLRAGAIDYTVNTFLFNTSLSQLFFGDPALTAKKDVQATLVDYGKRLAKDIAPGRDGEFSHSPSYITITAADYEPLITELEGIAGYQSPANATDAQEVTTMQEHLAVMYAYGKITKSQFDKIQGIITAAQGGYYTFEGTGLEELIFQPMKPVATGLRAPVNGVMSYDYVKTSSFPLYPPMTAGLEIDKLRVAMEQSKVDRMNFISGKKIGAPAKIVTLYNEDGSINNDVFQSEDWLSSSRQVLDRSEFRIQQEVPYDEDKDSILTVSQMNTLITEKVPSIPTPFNYQGREVSGTELRKIKEDIRIKLIKNNHNKFLDKVGATFDENKQALVFKDKKKFYKLLAQEAATRDGYTVNDTLALSSYVDNSDELVVPLAFTPSANKFEGMMMSLIKKIVQMKMPGKSFIQASPAGFRTMATWEDSNLDTSSIVWTKSFDGELKTAYYSNRELKVTPIVTLRIVREHNMSSPEQRSYERVYQISEDGKKVGTVELDLNGTTGQITGIDIDKEHRRKGYAYNTYLQLNNSLRQKGYSLESDHTLYDGSLGMWEKFKKDGLVDVVRKPVKVNNGKGGYSYSAKFKFKQDIQPAQILVGFNYFNKEGNRINIQDFIKEENGKKMLNTEKLPPELFQLIGARIPNQGHSSMLPIEIVGFLPQSMGDMVVVPAAITKQMGADFDVDKLYTYHRAYKQDGDRLVVGQLDKVAFQDEYINNLLESGDERDVPQIEVDDAYNAALGKDDLVNQYFDVHWSVLTNPAMFESMMSPLDKNDLKDMADEVSGNKKVPYYWSPSYQMNDFQSMKGAKVLVGQTSLSLTHNAVVQDKNLHLAIMTKDGPQQVGITVAAEDGSLLELTHLSGFGTTSYNGEIRTKSDNIQIQQSESVDHAKNRVIDKINLTPATAAASLAMSRLQTGDEGQFGEEGFVPGRAINLEYNALLLSQPIVLEYAMELSKSNDTLSTIFESNVKDKIFRELSAKYLGEIDNAVGDNEKDSEGISKMQKLLFNPPLVNPEFLRNSLKNNGTKEWLVNQVVVLNLFKDFDEVGSQLVTLQSTMAQNTRGAGKDVLAMLNTIDRKAKLGMPGKSPMYIEGVEELFNGTEVGAIYQDSIVTANALYSPELPYLALQPTYKYLIEQAGKDTLNDETKKRVFNAMKSFVFNSKELGLFTDAYAERARLLFNTSAGDSLARRIQVAKNTWAKNDYFLQRLSVVTDPDGLTPEMVEYNAAKASQLDDIENSKSWLNLMTSEDSIKKALGEDLLRYTFVTGGLQNARNFVKFIPWAAIEGSQIAFGLREFYNKIENINENKNLREQIIQHNPNLAKQSIPVTKDGITYYIPESGSEYETPPDTFLLPSADIDNKTTNPAKGLFVMVTGEDGKLRETYPDYLSVRAENKWMLYKQASILSDGQIMYAKIDTLGNSKLQLSEYSDTAEPLRSLVPENRAPWYEFIETKTPNITNGSINWNAPSFNLDNIMRQVGLVKKEGNYTDLLNSFSVISQDQSQASHIRVISSILEDLSRNPAEEFAYNTLFGFDGSFKFSFEPLPGQSASFSSNRNLMRFNSNIVKNKQGLAEDMVHEHLHYHTALMAIALDGPTNWKARGMNSKQIAQFNGLLDFITANPNLHNKLSGVEEMRALAIEELERRIVENHGQEYWDSLPADGSNYNAKLKYALGSLTEFIPHVLSNSQTIQFLNNIQYDGPKSILGRLIELFSQLWGAMVEAFGVQRSTLAEESVKRTLDLLLYRQQPNLSKIKENTFDFSSFYADIENGSLASPELTTIEKVIGKLEEQRQALLDSFTGLTDRKARLDKNLKIDAIKEDIAKLKQEQDLMLVSEIGKKHIQWVRDVIKNENPTENQIMGAITIGNMWKNINDIIYQDAAISSNDVTEMNAMIHKLITKSKDYITEASSGVIRGATDWKESELQDITTDTKLLRSLSLATKSRVISHVANFVETTARNRDEDSYRLMEELNSLEKEMLAHVGSKKGLELLYNKMMQPGEGAFGLALRYSQKWFNWRELLIKERNGKLAGIEQKHGDSPIGNKQKREVWNHFWKQIDDNAVFVDTSIFFQPENGEFKTGEGFEAAKLKLERELGKEHAERTLAKAQEKYLQYIEDKMTYKEVLDETVVRGDLTQEEADVKLAEWQNRSSPNVFFDRVNNARTFSPATEKYIVLSPKAATNEFWNDSYKELMADEKTADFYNRYSALIDELMSYLPKTIQERGGAGFLPIVNRELMSDSLGTLDWIKSYFSQEKFIKTMTATDWEEANSKQGINKIPIDYVNSSKVELEDRSKDLIGIAKMFGMMAIHYKHFSAAKDYIDMGTTVLNEIHKARIEGSGQMEQNGKVVTVKQGLRNALDALEYLKDYAMYRKPRALETNLGGKLYGVKKDNKTNYSLSPFKQATISKRVNKLLFDRTKLTERFTSGELNEQEYQESVDPINVELKKYEGHTLFGSKIGDKLIGINQLKALSYNPFSAVANVGFGLISIYIHGNAGIDFTRREASAAQAIVLKAKTNKALAQKIVSTMDRLGVIGDYVDSRYGKVPEINANKAAWKRTLDPYAMMRKSDFYMKAVTSIAVMLHQKVDVNGESLRLWDTLNEGGQWNVEKYGENTSWYSKDVKEQTSWNKLKNKIIRVNTILHGNQDKNAPRMLNKFVLGRLLGQFRSSWLPEGWYSRFQDERYDENLDRNIKGRYRTIGQLGIGGYLAVTGKQLLSLIPGVKINPYDGTLIKSKSLAESEVDIENMKRNFAELGFFLGLTAAVVMLKSLKDDDEPNPAIQMLLNMLIRTKQDIDFYASTGVMDAVFRDPIPAFNVLKDYWKAVKASGRYIIDDDYEFNEWLLKLTKAGIPLPQATLVNKTNYMMNKDLDALQ